MKAIKNVRWIIPMLLASVVCAQTLPRSDTTPVIKNIQVKNARVQYEKALQDSMEAFRKAQVKVNTEYLNVLTKARMDAYKADNAAEVEAISIERNRVLEEIKNLETEKPLVQIKSITGTVKATQAWTKVLDVKKGQVLEITATGTWSVNKNIRDCTSGPEGTNRKGNSVVEVATGMLIGKVGNGEPFAVGASKEFTAEQDGALYLGINEKDNLLGDNSGYLKVIVNLKGLK